VSIAIVFGIVYAYTFEKEPQKYPWWWAVALVVFWSGAAVLSIRSIRGRKREKVSESWGVDG
jgi:hypothetical protein